MYINIPSQYDSVSMAKRFHIGFYGKCTKCDEMYMCLIRRLEEEADAQVDLSLRWAHRSF